MGKLPLKTYGYTPYVSPTGYSRHMHNYECLDHLGENKQRYASLAITQFKPEPSSKLMSSARTYRQMEPLVPITTTTRSVPYMSRYNPSGHYQADASGLTLYPSTQEGGKQGEKGKRGAMEEFLDTTYRAPWVTNHK